MAEASQQGQEPHVIPKQYTQSNRLVNSALFVIQGTSSVTATTIYLLKQPWPLSKIMTPVAEFFSDFASGSLHSVTTLSTEQSKTYVVGLVALFWVCFNITAVRKGHSASYLVTPVALAVFLNLCAWLSWVEFWIVVLPLLLTLWELTGDK